MSACDVKEKCIETDRVLRQQLKDEPSLDDLIVFEEKFEELIVPDSSMFIKFFENSSVHQTEGKRENKQKQDFKSLSKLNQVKCHKSSVESERRKSKIYDFRCFFCDKVFSKINMKKDHIKRDHATELTCRVCKSKKPSPLTTEQCLKDHKFGFDFLCQVRILLNLLNIFIT